MTKNEFFLAAMNAGMFLKRRWINNVFYMTRGEVSDNDHWFIRRDSEGIYFNNPETNQFEKIDGITDPNQALLSFQDRITINPGDVGNYVNNDAGDLPPLDVPAGNVFYNHLCLFLCFGSLIPFQTGFIDIGKIEGIIAEKLIDDPDDNDDPDAMAPDGKIYVRQLQKFVDHSMSLLALAPYEVTSVSRKSLQGHPDGLKVKQEEIERNKERLNDPSVIAKIGDVTEKLDKEWLKDDPTSKFYRVKESKYYSDIRRRQFYMFGGESPFGDGTTVEFISKSLEQGIDTDKLPTLWNSLRYGSFNRGKQTQLGGESTKTIYKMLGTYKIAEEDCGTKVHLPIKVLPEIANTFIGHYHVVNGENIIITRDNIESLIGTTVNLRTLITCKTPGFAVCAICAGSAMSIRPDGLAAGSGGVGGRFLTAFLKAMHKATLKTTKWNFKERLR